MKTKLVYGNCLLGGMYLVLRGRVKRVALVSSHCWAIPAHIVVETTRNRILHFRYATDQNPLYFKGYFEAIKLSEAAEYLRREDRKVIKVLKPKPFMALAVTLFLLLLVPWCLYWPLEVLAWRIPRDFFNLGKRRLHRLGFNRHSDNDSL